MISDFGVNTLKLKKWAIVHSTDAFGTGGMNALVQALKAYDITPVLVQGYTNNSQDFTPIVLAIKKSGADVIGSYMTNSPDVGIFAKQLRQLGLTTTWVGSPSVITDTALKLAGPGLYGVYGIADFTPGASPEAKAYADKYRAKYNLEADVYSSWAYDAMHILADADQPGQEHRHGGDPQGDPRHLRLQRRRRHLLLRRERRRAARLQRRQERQRQGRLHQAHRQSEEVTRLAAVSGQPAAEGARTGEGKASWKR